MATNRKVKNAPLEASNVAVLLEHIPIGATRSIHSLQVKRVEADHYSIAGGPVIDLVDAMAKIGSYSGKHSNPDPAYVRANPKARKSQDELLAAAEKKLRAAAKKKATEERRKIRAAMTQAKTKAKLARAAMLAAKPPKGSKVSAAKRAAAVERLESKIAKLMAKRSNPANTTDEALKALGLSESDIETFKEYAKKMPMQALQIANKAMGGTGVEGIRYRHPEHPFFQYVGGGAPTDVTLYYDGRDFCVGAWRDFVEGRLDNRIVLDIPGSFRTRNPAAKFERGKAAGGGHREERGYFYEVLNSAGTVVALTTSKDEAQDVCNNPKQLGLPKSEYSFRHIGGKKLVPTTEAGTRARKVK